MLEQVTKNGEPALRFRYPRGRRRLGIAYGLVLAALSAIFVAPVVGAALLVLTVSFPLLTQGVETVVSWRGPWIRHDGILFGRRLLAWNEIEEVDFKGKLVGQVRFLRPQDKKRRFLSWSLSGRRFVMLGLPSVFREFLALLAARPDLPVTDAIRQRIKTPDRDQGLLRRIVTVGISVQLTVVLGVLLFGMEGIDPHGTWLLPMAVGIFLMWSPHSSFLMMLWEDGPGAFVTAAISAPFLVLMVYVIGSVLGVPLIGAQVIFIEIAFALGLALILLRRRTLTAAVQWTALAALIVVPAAAYAGLRAFHESPQDVTEAVQAKEPILAVWGDSDRYLTFLVQEDWDHVTDTTDWSRRPVPPIAGTANLVHLDDEILVRRQYGGDEEPDRLLICEFATDRQIEAPVPAACRASRRAVSPDGRKLVWLDVTEEDDAVATLRVWDRTTEQDVIPPIPLDPRLPNDSPPTEWEAHWTDDGQVVAFRTEKTTGKVKAEETTQLRALRVAIPDGTVSAWTSPPVANGHWTLAPNGWFAFADSWPLTQDDHGRFLPEGGVYVFEVGSDVGRKMPGAGTRPDFTWSDLYGFRGCTDGARYLLMRVDAADATEQVVCELDPDQRTEGASADGNVVCLVQDRFLGWPRATVLHVPSGRRHTIRMPSPSVLGLTTLGVSRDGRRLLVEAMAISPNDMFAAGVGEREFEDRYEVHTMPDNWP